MNKVKNFVNDVKYNARNTLIKASVAAPVIGIAASSGSTVFASDVNGDTGPTVDGNGKVTFAGGNKDLKSGTANALKQGQFIIGVVAAIAGLFLIAGGMWYGHKAAKEIQQGNSSGYSNAGAVVMGTVIGGLLLAAAGAVLSIGAMTGHSFFG